MNVKKIVKVMNFHALLRVDAARNTADSYMVLQEEISAMIDIVLNNKNLQLDRRILKPKKNQPELNIYIGSDYGFCGGVNSAINAHLAKDQANKSTKISIGKKLRKYGDTNLHIAYEELESYRDEIERLCYEAIHDRKFSSINLIYNHYYNMTTITPVRSCIYPMKKSSSTTRYTGDFVIEGNPATMLENMVLSYLRYQINIAYANSYASENIMRQNATRQSLQKIEEKEEEETMLYRREKNRKSFAKVIDSFVKRKSLGGGFQS
ncbi:MAG: FoF1 ATP synthase subunit gamma [Eubacteriales bacterium]